MRRRIMTVLIILSFFLSGCMNGISDSASSEDSSNNHAPVIYFWGENIEGPGQGTYSSPYTYFNWSWQISVVDIDGEISEVGLDTNLDGEIDYEFSSSNWSDPEQMYQGPMNFSANDATHLGYHENGADPRICYFAFNLIAIDDDQAKSITPYSKVMLCQVPVTEPEWTPQDFSMYQFSVGDASSTPSASAGDDLVYVSMDSGDDIPWSEIIIQISADGTTYKTCTNPDKAIGTECAISDNNDGKFSFGEEITIREGSDDICSDSCVIQVKILQYGSNEVIFESTQTNVI